MATHPKALLTALTELENRRELNVGADRRHFPRIEVRGEGELLAVDQNRPQRHPVPIQLRDVAWGGLGFVCQMPLEAGSQWLAIFMDQGQQVGQQSVVVRHCEEVGSGGLYLVGSQVCLENGLISLLGVDRRRLAP